MYLVIFEVSEKVSKRKLSDPVTVFDLLLQLKLDLTTKI
jgi:hypothetical protein